MAFKILTQTGIPNTNEDGAEFNKFLTGDQCSVVSGRGNECAIRVDGGSFYVGTGEILIHGHRVVVQAEHEVPQKIGADFSGTVYLIGQLTAQTDPQQLNPNLRLSVGFDFLTTRVPVPKSNEIMLAKATATNGALSNPEFLALKTQGVVDVLNVEATLDISDSAIERKSIYDLDISDQFVMLVDLNAELAKIPLSEVRATKIERVDSYTGDNMINGDVQLEKIN